MTLNKLLWLPISLLVNLTKVEPWAFYPSWASCRRQWWGQSFIAGLRLPPEQDSKSSLFLSDDEFLEQLQKDFGWRLGRLEKVGKRASYPLILRHRQQNISHRFAIVVMLNKTSPFAGQVAPILGIRMSLLWLKSYVQPTDDVGRYTVLLTFKSARTRQRHYDHVDFSFVHLVLNIL